MEKDMKVVFKLGSFFVSVPMTTSDNGKTITFTEQDTLTLMHNMRAEIDRRAYAKEKKRTT